MNILMAYYFCNKSSISDVRLGYIETSENIEIFKIKLSWSIFLLIFKSWPLFKQNKIGKQMYKVDFSVFLATSNNCNNNKRGEWNRIHLETYLQKTAKNGPERYLSFGPNRILVTLKWDGGRSSVYEMSAGGFF